MIDEDRIARIAPSLCVADATDLKAEITVGTDRVGKEVGGDCYHEAMASTRRSYADEARRTTAAMMALGVIG